MVKHAEGEGVGRRGGGSDIFLWGDKGANFVFRVMGVITSDRKQIPILCVLRLRKYVCVCGGGGVKNGLLLFGSF